MGVRANDQKPGREENMSFTRILYKLLKSPKLTFNPLDLLNPNSDLRVFLNELSDGRYVDAIERHEIQKFAALAKCIDQHVELLPLVQDAINDKKNDDIKVALLQHRVLIHSLFYNKSFVLGELSRIIDELENQTKMQEYTHQMQGYKIIQMPGSQVVQKSKGP